MNDRHQPPTWVDRLINRFAPPAYAEEISGDLYEMFLLDYETRGIKSARRRYTFNALGFLLKRFFWKKSPTYNPSTLMMLSSYFKMAARSLRAHSGNAMINTLGLVIGIASAIVILTILHFETSFDTFHTNSEKIYRIVRVSGKDMSEFRTGISFPVPAAFKNEIASIKHITALEYFGGATPEILDKSGKTIRKFRTDHGVVVAEPTFFDVFDFKDTKFRWIAGSPKKSLTEPFSVVLTKSLADLYFPEGNVMGAMIRYDEGFEVRVTGIIEDLPANSDFPFTALVSYSSMKDFFRNDWVSVNDSHQAYMMLEDGVTKEEMEAQLEKVHRSHTDENLKDRHYLLQKLSDIHFDPKFGTFTGRTITKPTLLALGLVGIFLLLAGSINYINLATAQATMRSKEIGLRKVMGSNRRDLIVQFMIETFLIVLLAGVMGMGVAYTLLLHYQSLLNITIDQFAFTDPTILLGIIAIVTAVTLLAGLYPSFAISNFNPVAMLGNKFNTGKLGGVSLRKVLVVVQFTITQILVVCTFIVVSQIQFFQRADMGFDQEAIITLPLPSNEPAKLQLLESQLRSKSFVSNVTFSYSLPSGVNRARSYKDIYLPGAKTNDDYKIFEFHGVDNEYIDVFGIDVIAGRKFNASDSVRSVVINKSLAKTLGFKSPQEAIGQEVLAENNNQRFTIIGVVGDFYNNSLKEQANNVAMFIRPNLHGNVSIKLNLDNTASNWPNVISEIDETWSAAYPEGIFDYNFFEDNVRQFYAQEQKYAMLFQFFSIVFMVIGCLGLYGLITFVVQRKSKEVAVRKVLGATVSNILVMFSREYVQLILLSFLIAVPVAYYLVNDWLSSFANHIPLQWYLFVIPGLFVLAIAIVVVFTKSVRAANSNPVHRLKYE